MEEFQRKITIENTSKVVEFNVNGRLIPTRIWEGHTDTGIPVHCYVTRIAVHNDNDHTQFEKELLEQRAPSAAVQEIPLRLVL